VVDEFCIRIGYLIRNLLEKPKLFSGLNNHGFLWKVSRLARKGIIAAANTVLYYLLNIIVVTVITDHPWSLKKCSLMGKMTT